MTLVSALRAPWGNINHSGLKINMESAVININGVRTVNIGNHLTIMVKHIINANYRLYNEAIK